MRGPSAAWRLEQAEGLLVAVCGALEAIDAVRHVFSTRRASDGDGAPHGFDLGGTEPGAGVEKRRLRLARAAGLADRVPIVLRQVHGDRVVWLDRDDPTAAEQPVEADGAILVRDSPGGAVPAVRSADCVALLLADGEGRAVAALHGGWRGTAAGIVPRAVDGLRQRGVAPRTLRAALGPAVGPCCYVVGPEVRSAIDGALGAEAAGVFLPRAGDRCALDLHAALRLQLERAGVDPDGISAAPWCTACREDLFFSHRRDGARAGRMMALIGWAPCP